MTNPSKSHRMILSLCYTALLAALVAVSSQIQIQIPSIVGFSRFHLGNVMCALSGILLGPWWGGLAAGMGSMIFDLFNPAYIAEAPITFVTKGMYGLVAGVMFVHVFKGRSNYLTEAASTLCAAVAYGVIYLAKNFFYNGMLLGGLTGAGAWLAMLEKVPATLFNGAVAVIFAPVLGVAVNQALKRARLNRPLARQE